MAKLIIVWTETAANQRREILKYWRHRTGSTQYSEKLLRLISKRTKTLLGYSAAYRVAGFENIRVSAMGHFSIFYRRTDQQLIITAFWDNRQDPEKLLQILRENPDS